MKISLNIKAKVPTVRMPKKPSFGIRSVPKIKGMVNPLKFNR